VQLDRLTGLISFLLRFWLFELLLLLQLGLLPLDLLLLKPELLQVHFPSLDFQLLKLDLLLFYFEVEQLVGRVQRVVRNEDVPVHGRVYLSNGRNPEGR